MKPFNAPRLAVLAAALTLPMLSPTPASAGDVRWSITFGSGYDHPRHQHRTYQTGWGQRRCHAPRYRAPRYDTPRYQHCPPRFVHQRKHIHRPGCGCHRCYQPTRRHYPRRGCR